MRQKLKIMKGVKNAKTNRMIKGWLCGVFLLLVAMINVAAQHSPAKKTIPIPADEEFSVFAAVLVESAGAKRTIYERSEQETIHIYNEDGSLWYEFSLYKSSPLYYKTQSKPEFKPYNLTGYGDFIIAVTVKARSTNWYQVVVNEDTGETKYVWSGEPALGLNSWQKYVRSAAYVTFDRAKNPVRETPNGKVIDAQISGDCKFAPRLIEGDWIQVICYPNQGNEKGWIRWIKGTELLIDFGIKKIDR